MGRSIERSAVLASLDSKKGMHGVRQRGEFGFAADVPD